MATQTDDACSEAIAMNLAWGERAFGTEPTNRFRVEHTAGGEPAPQTVWGEVLQRGSDQAEQDDAPCASVPAESAGSGCPPLSFVYDGVPSSQFLASWLRTSREVRDPEGVRRSLSYTDPDSGLEVRTESIAYSGAPGVDWTVYLTNTGNRDTPLIEELRSLDVWIEPGLAEGFHPKNQVVLHRLNGTTSGFKYCVSDFLPVQELLQRGERVEFGNSDAPFGCSSVYAAPFFNIDWHGGGVITALGWSGRWGVALDYDQEGALHLTAGLSGTRLRLRPGETVRGPRVLQVYWKTDDTLRSYNLFRRTMFRHVLPRVHGELVVPPIACSPNMWVLQNDGTVQDVYQYLEGVRGCGFEMCWIDAFYMAQGWPKGVGNYGRPLDMLWDKARFPDGLRPIRERAREMGMAFLVWFAPERAEPGTEVYRKHPEWLLKPEGVETTGMYDLGNDEARKYMTDYLKAITEELGLDCIRFDCGAIADRLALKDGREADRDGMADIRYHEGLYRMWDDLLDAFPGLYIDNCCGGGTRIDLETCSRSLPLWRTDGTGWPIMMWMPPDLLEGAMQNQIITAGLSRYVPLSTGGQVGTTPYLFRSALNAGYVMCDDARSDGFDREQVRKAIAEAKRVRGYFLSDYYPLSEITTSPRDWCVTQYHRPSEGDGMVRAFRRHASPYPEFECSLYDIEPDADYNVVISYTFDAGASQRIRGQELQGLKLRIPDTPGSALVEYARVAQ